MTNTGASTAFTSWEQTSPCSHSDSANLSSGQPTSPQQVSTNRLSHSERENAILLARELVNKHERLRDEALFEYDLSGDFGAKGLADRHRLLAEYAQRSLDALIEGRKPTGEAQ